MEIFKLLLKDELAANIGPTKRELSAQDEEILRKASLRMAELARLSHAKRRANRDAKLAAKSSQLSVKSIKKR